MVTALGEGVETVKPVRDLNEALNKKLPYGIVAAERNGKQVPEADLGNSPIPFLGGRYRDYTLVLTTSNGTKALNQAYNSSHILIATFLNASALADYLKKINQDIILLCAGRHGLFSLEDSMLAGCLLAKTSDHFQRASDAALNAATIFNAHANNWQDFLYQGIHAQYLSQMGKKDDLEHAFQLDTYPIVPEFKHAQLTINDH